MLKLNRITQLLKNVLSIGLVLSMLLPYPAQAAAQSNLVLQTAPVIECVQSLLLLAQQQYNEAKIQLEEAVMGMQASSDSNRNALGMCALFLAIVHHNTGDWVEALAAYNIALPAFQAKANPDPQMEWAAHFGISTVYLAQGRFADAYTTMQQALPLTGSPANADETACTDADVGGSAGEQSWTTEGLKPLARAVNLNNIGIALAVPHSQNLSFGGTLEDSQPCFKAALLIAQHLGNQPTDFDSILPSLLLKMTLGGVSSENAMSHIFTEILIGSVVPELAKAFEPIILSNLGQVYAFEKKYPEAQTYLEQALQQIKASQAQRNTDELQMLIPLLDTMPALLGSDLDPTWQALLHNIPQMVTSISLLGELVNLNGEAIVLNNLALVYNQQKKTTEAQDTFEQALDIFENKLANYPGTINVHVNLGYLAQQAGKTDIALTHYEQAIQALASVRSVAEGGVTRLRANNPETLNFVGLQGILSQQADVYALAANLYYQKGETAKAFQAIERGRARLFFDMISTSNAYLKSQDAKLLTAVRKAFDTKVQATVSLTQLRAAGVTNSELLTKSEQELKNAEDLYAAKMTNLKAGNPQLLGLTPDVDSTIDLKTLQTQVLDKDTTLIVYYIAEGLLVTPTNQLAVAWVIDANKITPIKLKVTGDKIRKSVTYLRNLIEHKTPATDQASQLYTDLFAPLKPYIRHNNLVVVPHGSLHYLPFAALWDATRKHYLIQDYTITYAPSASILPLIQSRRNPNHGQALVMGNPDVSPRLVATESEAMTVANLYGVKPVLGKAATETYLRQHAKDMDVIHLAAHGSYNTDDPLTSSVFLTADRANDGTLQVSEVFSLPLSAANLVVLSACKTNMGEPSMGEEITGLTRSFLYAGTPSIMTTLWSIEDKASAALMASFYQHLRTESSFAAALRAAQLEVLGKAGWRDPYYWAAFTLHGDYLGSDR